MSAPITLTLLPEHQQSLLNVLDAALRQGGLSALNSVYTLVTLLQPVIQTANTPAAPVPAPAATALPATGAPTPPADPTGAYPATIPTAD